MRDKIAEGASLTLEEYQALTAGFIDLSSAFEPIDPVQARAGGNRIADEYLAAFDDWIQSADPVEIASDRLARLDPRTIEGWEAIYQPQQTGDISPPQEAILSDRLARLDPRTIEGWQEILAPQEQGDIWPAALDLPAERLARISPIVLRTEDLVDLRLSPVTIEASQLVQVRGSVRVPVVVDQAHREVGPGRSSQPFIPDYD